MKFVTSLIDSLNFHIRKLSLFLLNKYKRNYDAKSTNKNNNYINS